MISTKTNLIILESVGSKGQANNCVNAQHHFRFIRACDQATSSVHSTSCFSWWQDKKELSLKVDSDGYVDKTAGVGDPAIEGQAQLARLHHHGGRGVREGTFGCFRQRWLKTKRGFLYKRSELYLGGVEILQIWCNFQFVPAQVYHFDFHDQVASRWYNFDSLIVIVQ